MMRRFIVSTISTFFAVLAVWTPSMAGARMHSEVACKPTDKPLTYHCTVKLTDRKTGEPIENAKLMMHTSMPSMPMAHHMAPVEGMPGNEPGVYHGRFHFEMAGEWAIDIRVSAPSRDQMRHTIMVGSGHMKHEKQMKHGGQMKQHKQ
ncbi:MAG: FixH family protein [Candidatus Methylomirabilia bacterium]